MSTKRIILIADDEPVGRQLLQAILFPLNHDFLFAENGKEALDLALSQRPDLVLLDVMMPEMDGVEVCSRIKSGKNTRNIPVMLITALDDRDSRLKGLEAGANDYISKPYDRGEILAKVKNILSIDSGQNMSEANTVSQTKTITGDLNNSIIQFFSKYASPSTGYIKSSFTGYFSLFADSNIFQFLYKSSQNKILFFANNPGGEPLGIICSLIVNRLVWENEAITLTEILTELNRIISKELANLFSVILESDKFEIILCSLVKGTEIQIGGLNHAIVIGQKSKLDKFELENSIDFIKNEKLNKIITLELKDIDTIYFINHSFNNYIKADKSIEGMYGGFDNYFIQLCKQDIQHQEKQVNYLIEKATQDTRLNNAAFVAIKF